MKLSYIDKINFIGNNSRWMEYYNMHRSHSSLQGKTHFEKYKALESITLSQNDVEATYDPSKEQPAIQNYRYDQIIKALRKK